MSFRRRVPLVCALALAIVAAPHSALADHTVRKPSTVGGVPLEAQSSPGKPQPPISAEYRLSAAPAIGAPLVVTFTARADESFGELSIDARGTGGADVQFAPARVPSAAAGEFVWEIAVAPLSSAGGRVNVLVSGRDSAGVQARSFSVALRTTSLPEASKVRVIPNGERLIALPADESR
jgi:hypothetical protein